MKDYSRYTSTPLKGGVRRHHHHSPHTPLVVTPSSPAPHTDILVIKQQQPQESQQLLPKSSPSGGEESTSTCATSSTAAMHEILPDGDIDEMQHTNRSTQQPQKAQKTAATAAATPGDSNMRSPPLPKGSNPTSINGNTTSRATPATGIPVPSASSSSSSPQLRNMLTSLTAADALSVRREGVEATISKLRSALDEASNRDATAKAALAKSDAVILELRSSLRQLKRQLDKVQNEKTETHTKLQQAYRDLTLIQQQSRQEMALQSRQHQLELQQLQHQLVDMSKSHNKEERVGELQVQLDRAHAQILTADMVRKELEDTLEAEQYTWELRVQDQERTIQQLQHECNNLADELSKCRTQNKEQEDQWNQQIRELQERLQQAHEELTERNGSYNPSNNNSSEDVAALKEKIAELEQERGELQSCLDEALQELEAVDAEMQGNWHGEREQLLEENERLQRRIAEGNVESLEPLQQLYRWLLERNGMEENAHHMVPNDAGDLLDRIKVHLDEIPANNNRDTNGNEDNNNNHANDQLDAAMEQVRDLEAQLSVYRGDLRAREESSAELRASLKEAVALLKPLQDAVAKSEREKQELQQHILHLRDSPEDSDERIRLVKEELAAKNKELQRLQHQVHSLEVQLAEAKEISAAKSVIGRLSPVPRTPLTSTPRSMQAPNEEVHEKHRKEESSNLSKAREEVRAKRAAESALKQLLRDAQDRFTSLHKQNIAVEEENRELSNRLHEAEGMLTPKAASGLDDSDHSPQPNDELAVVKELQEKLQQLEQKYQEKEAELAAANEELERARSVAPALVEDYRHMEAELQELQTSKERMQELEVELAAAKKDLLAKREAERLLNKSLKEALGLLKPLQLHLEDAEQEKKELIKELKAYRRRLMRLERGGENDATSYKSRSVGLPDEVNFEAIRVKEHLEAAVRQLEQENSQLHDALEDMSHNMNVSAVSGTSRKQEERLLEELVELNSRYEVTQGKLKDAHVENHALLDALKLREGTEQGLRAELTELRQKLKKSESELENAKQIATSALIKVEELTTSVDNASSSKKQQQDQVPRQVGGRQRFLNRVKL